MYMQRTESEKMICKVTMVQSACLRSIKNNLPMLITLQCSSKAQKKELLKHLKPDTIKAMCECVINIINKNIKVSDQEKRKIN